MSDERNISIGMQELCIFICSGCVGTQECALQGHSGALEDMWDWSEISFLSRSNKQTHIMQHIETIIK